jgi:hypothetical protein
LYPYADVFRFAPSATILPAFKEHLVHTFALSSLVATVIDDIVPIILLIGAVVTVTGNYASKCFFEACGLGLRARYHLAVLMAIMALAFAAGLPRTYASMVMIAILLTLSALALRTGSKSSSARMATVATLLLITEAAA